MIKSVYLLVFLVLANTQLTIDTHSPTVTTVSDIEATLSVDVFLTSFLGYFGIIIHDSALCFTSQQSLGFFQAITVLQNFAQDFSGHNLLNQRFDGLNLSKAISNMGSAYDCVLNSLDFQNLLQRLNITTTPAAYIGLAQTYILANPSTTLTNLNSIQSYISSNNFVGAGLAAGSFVQSLTYTSNTNGQNTFTTFAFFNGVFNYLNLALPTTIQACFNTTTAQTFNSYIKGWGDALFSTSTSQQAAQASITYLNGTGASLLASIPTTVTCLENSADYRSLSSNIGLYPFTAAFNTILVQMIATNTSTAYSYLQSLSTIYTDVLGTAADFALALRQVGQFNTGLHTVASNPVIVGNLSVLTTVVNYLFANYNINDQDILNCFDTKKAAEFFDLINNLFYLAETFNSNQYGEFLYYSDQVNTLRQEVNLSLNCIYGSVAYANLLTAIKIPNNNLINAFLLNNPGQFATNFSSIFTDLRTGQYQAASTSFANLLGVWSNAINYTNNVSMFDYNVMQGFYTYTFYYSQLSWPSGYPACYFNTPKASVDYSFFTQFFQILGNQSATNAQIISSLAAFLGSSNSSGTVLKNQVFTNWECSSFASSLNYLNNALGTPIQGAIFPQLLTDTLLYTQDLFFFIEGASNIYTYLMTGQGYYAGQAMAEWLSAFWTI